MNAKGSLGVILTVCIGAIIGHADSLELKNGSLVNGTFIGGNQTRVTFQVGSSLQSYDIADVCSLRFDSDAQVSSTSASSNRPTAPSDTRNNEDVQPLSSVTIPAGTRISIRTIDSIDSSTNHVGDRFQASLAEPVLIDGHVVIPKGTDVYGRLEESKETGTFTGRSQLRLQLTGIVVNGQNVPLVTGEYEVSGKSKGESTAKRTAGGAAIGGIIGAIAGGGKGAAIGAGTGAAVGAGSEIITKGDQVKIPSETLLDFTLQKSLTISKRAS